MGPTFLKHGRENIAAIDGCLPRALGLQGGTLEHALERRSIIRRCTSAPCHGFHIVRQKFFEFALEHGKVPTAMAQHVAPRFFVKQGMQQMLQRDVLVTPLQGCIVRLTDGLL
jgi:hypothetical protein